MADEQSTLAATTLAATTLAAAHSAVTLPALEPALVLAPGGRLEAVVAPCGARLRRRLGVAGSRDGLLLLRFELLAVRAAVLAWTATRDGWASFRHSCEGFRPGHGGAWWFTPPGAGSPRVRTGVHAVGLREGRAFSGVERPRPFAPSRVAPGVTLVRELRRTGEPETPPAGMRTGVVYSLVRGLELTAWREEARLARGTDEVWLERGEEGLFLELTARRTPGAGPVTSASAPRAG